MEPVIYRRRRSAVARSEREWRVEDKALVTRGGSGRERRLPWRDVVSIRLRASPARFRPWRHVLQVQMRNGRKYEIDNAHWLGFRSFEERTESYCRFVRAALARIAVENPRARALMGETPRRYFALLLCGLLAFSVLAAVLATVPTPLDTLPYANLFKLGLVVALLPVFAFWILGAMPRGVALDCIPERAFPCEAAAHAEAHGAAHISE